MSFHVYCSGYMVITDDLPCKIGKHKGDNEWIGEVYPSSVAQMLGALLVGMRENCYKEKYNPLINPLRIVWKNYPNYDEEKGLDIIEDEWYDLDDETLKSLVFPHGSEAPLNLTITPHTNKWGTSWHIVFEGDLRDRDYNYFKSIEKWWKTLQNFFEVGSGYIVAEGQGKKWQNIV